METRTEEQQELEEQAVALQWQTDSRMLKKALKYNFPLQLNELQHAKYFAEEYIPFITLGQSLSDVISTSFIQELPYTKWQTSAILNAKKFLSVSQKNMLEHWPKQRKKLFGKNPLFLRDTTFTPLDVTRIYAILQANKDLSAQSREDTPPSIFSKKTLFSIIDALPFFGEQETWSDRAKIKFNAILHNHLYRNLFTNEPQERSAFIAQQLIPSTLREENSPRAIFKVDLLGKLADSLSIFVDKKSLGLIVSNLENHHRRDVAKKVRGAFHMDPDPKPLALFKFFKRDHSN